jgi:hypothetical protein
MNEKGPVEQFHERHGDFIIFQKLIIYQDGASRENHALGALREPPENPYERYRFIIKFWEVKLSLAVELFDVQKRRWLGQAKDQLNQNGNTGGPPETTDDAVLTLNELKRKAKYCQSKLEAAKAELERAKPVSLRDDIGQQNRQRIEDFVMAIEKIEI